MDFEDVNRLAGFGFAGRVCVSDLQLSCDSVPAECGVYLIARENTETVRFSNLEKSRKPFSASLCKPMVSYRSQF